MLLGRRIAFAVPPGLAHRSNIKKRCARLEPVTRADGNVLSVAAYAYWHDGVRSRPSARAPCSRGRALWGAGWGCGAPSWPVDMNMVDIIRDGAGNARDFHFLFSIRSR